MLHGATQYKATIPGADFDIKDKPAPAGQTYVVLSTADGKMEKANDDNIIAGVGILEVNC